MTTRKAYALWNSYASETDVGFQNTWSACVFDDRSQRDEWLDQQRDMASRRCTRRDALKHAVSEYRGDGRRYLQNPVTDALVQVA
jgi:hypothetical protein